MKKWLILVNIYYHFEVIFVRQMKIQCYQLKHTFALKMQVMFDCKIKCEQIIKKWISLLSFLYEIVSIVFDEISHSILVLLELNKLPRGP